MACTLRKRKKILPEQIWDHCARKLCIEIIEADDICTAKKNTYCKIYCGRYHVRTTTKKKTANPRWNELFYLEPKETDIIRIEVFYAKRLSDYLIGEVILGTVSTMKRETVYCSWREVVSKKRGNIGKLHLAFYFSTMLETRELSPPSCNQFFYKSYQDKMKTGDLIAYGGTGIIAAATKLVNNSEYSHLGLILNIPNKWTEERELFVMEIGRNNDGFLDAFFEEPRQGVTIHRLFERLHHFHGKSIDWIPLANTLSEENTQSLEDYAVNIHMAEDPFPYTLAGPVIDLLAQFGIGRNKFSVCDLYGPYIIASALMEGGITIRIDPKHCTLRDIITLPHLGKPVTLRKIDKSASSTVKHVRPIYPTKKTIRRKDPNEQPGSSFSLQEFSQTNLSVSQTDSTFSLKKTPFRKSSSFNESPRHSPPGQIPAFADPKGIKPTVPTSLPDFSRDITPVLPKVSPRDRASTTATERANLKPNNPNIPGYLLYPPEINLSKSASEIINKNNNQSIKVVSQPQPIFHPPLNLNDSCDSTSSMSDTTSPEVEENPVLVIDQWNDFRDNSNDVTIKL